MSRALKIAIVAVALGVAGYWYWSPLLALRSMQSAAKSGDADTFNDHVDYPKLRDSFKGQLSAMMAEHMSKDQSPSDNEYAKAGAAIGNMLGLALVDRFVDAMVRPEVVMRAMQNGRMQAPTPGAAGQTQPAAEKNDVDWVSERKGVDKYVAYAGKKDSPTTERVGLVLERSGFAHWKLTEIRLPAKL